MRRTKRSNTHSLEVQGEGLRRQKERVRVQPTDDELERKVRSALEDVYEVLLDRGEGDEESALAEVELVNDLTH
jgi:hypothetical protein